MYSVPDYNITPFSLEFLPSVSFTVTAKSRLCVCFVYSQADTLLSCFCCVVMLCLLLSPTLGLVSSHVWGAFLPFPSLLDYNNDTYFLQALLRTDTYTFLVPLCSHPVISTLLSKLFETFSNTKRAFICVLVGVLMMSSFESTSYSRCGALPNRCGPQRKRATRKRLCVE